MRARGARTGSHREEFVSFLYSGNLYRLSPFFVAFWKEKGASAACVLPKSINPFISHHQSDSVSYVTDPSISVARVLAQSESCYWILSYEGFPHWVELSCKRSGLWSYNFPTHLAHSSVLTLSNLAYKHFPRFRWCTESQCPHNVWEMPNPVRGVTI